MSLSSNLHPLITQRLKKILAQRAAPKLPEWPSYGNFCKVTQDPHFLKKCKGGTKGKFSQIAQKVALVWKAQKHSGADKNYPLFSMHLKCKDWKKVWRKKAGPKVPEWRSVMAILARSPKTRIFWKSAKVGQKEIFEKLSKKWPSLKRAKSSLAKTALSWI